MSRESGSSCKAYTRAQSPSYKFSYIYEDSYIGQPESRIVAAGWHARSVLTMIRHM